MYINYRLMNFKNLVFVDHPNSSFNGIMSKYRFDNGKELSIVAGDNLYCTTKYGNKKGNPAGLKVEEVASFEVMIGDEVKGWQSREDINHIIKENE